LTSWILLFSIMLPTQIFPITLSSNQVFFLLIWIWLNYGSEEGFKKTQDLDYVWIYHSDWDTHHSEWVVISHMFFSRIKLLTHVNFWHLHPLLSLHLLQHLITLHWFLIFWCAQYSDIHQFHYDTPPFTLQDISLSYHLTMHIDIKKCYLPMLTWIYSFWMNILPPQPHRLPKLNKGDVLIF